MPAISVVLPFHNADTTLSEAVESIRAQTFLDWELLLFDDGSTDGSLSIATNLMEKDVRIRLVESRRVGIVGALQRACETARGEFIARMDADDVSLSSRLARQYELMRSDPSIALCGCLVRPAGEELREGGARYYEWVNSLADHESIAREIFVECPIPHPTFLMRRDAFEKIGGYRDQGWAEDYDLVLRLWQREARFAKVPEVLLEWRHSAGRHSLTSPRYSPARFRALKRHFLEATVVAARGERRFFQWGAGEVGKRWLREWCAPKPEAVVDIHPRKIGTRIHGLPVIAPDDLPPPGASYILIAVGAPGARGEIRAWLRPRGYVEEEDYRFIA